MATCPPPEEHRPPGSDGRTICPTAGTRRNQCMIDSGADVCLAFHPRSTGESVDRVRRAEQAGIPVRVIGR